MDYRDSSTKPFVDSEPDRVRRRARTTVDLEEGRIVASEPGRPLEEVAGEDAGAGGGWIEELLRVAREVDALDVVWEAHFRNRSYVEDGDRYEDFRPAYHLGSQARLRNPDDSWEQMEPLLSRQWARFGTRVRLEWRRARLAIRDGWLESDPAALGGWRS